MSVRSISLAGKQVSLSNGKTVQFNDEGVAHGVESKEVLDGSGKKAESFEPPRYERVLVELDKDSADLLLVDYRGQVEPVGVPAETEPEAE